MNMHMVKLTIREAAERRGITTAYQLQKKLGAHPGMAARLWKGDMAQIALKTLDALCEVLDCELGDLLMRTNNSTSKAAKMAKKGAAK
jgi:DNA-binding Xre family transcriptional regulator